MENREFVEVNKEIVYAISRLELFRAEIEKFEPKYLESIIKNKDNIKLILPARDVDLKFENYKLVVIECDTGYINFKEIIRDKSKKRKGKITVKTPSSKLILPEGSKEIKCIVKRKKYTINGVVRAMYSSKEIFQALTIKKCIKKNFPEFV